MHVIAACVHGVLPILIHLKLGELCLGEPCAPYDITRVRHGTEEIKETIIGRKKPLLEIRKQSLKDHFQYMRLCNKELLLAKDRTELEVMFNCVGDPMSDNELHQFIVKQLALRYFALWHDHSTVCGCGFILVTCKEVYNSATYNTNAEYKALTG